MAGEVEAVVAAYFARLNGEDWDGLADLFTLDAELRAPGTPPRRGREAVASYYRAALAPYPEHLDEPTRVLVRGGAATVEITFTGRLANGEPLGFDAVDVFDVRDGRIARLTSWYDSHAVRQALARARAADLPRDRGAGSLAKPTAGPPAMLRTEVRDRVAWLTLDRPEKLNAMAPGFWAELRAALAAVEEDDAVRVVVFSGAGRCFSVGGDIEGFVELADVAARRAYVAGALGALRAVEELPKPTVAAVHGLALGGGCELTMVCDVVVADATAHFGTPEAAVGLLPGLAVVRGRAHAGLHTLKLLALTGEQLDAQAAQRAGLVDVVTAEGGHLEEAARLAGLIAARAPLALAAAKRILGRDAHEGYAHAVEAVALLQSTEDHAEGIRAFREERPPRFTGR